MTDRLVDIHCCKCHKYVFSCSPGRDKLPSNVYCENCNPEKLNVYKK